ncbi:MULTISPECIES: hypothetical protein [unclassified Rhizobium]|uniref:hypothetical protein n=1 Tax=unclassified Rhizobium TaxID=2613769 RepID=UPI001ADC8446|nr:MULTISPECIES: hypothetical protein [unclassified Rhizobium]MBO9100346.1 hypothetical protein [Rhizobium sp. L58/93]MBO9186239.1 hypothetical protein [Rhizobium sp. E27B/91]QXZ83157.1 hypothetical protein J5287_13895 [Rhizobium sp. K1/93]QXZ89331.1 hypothetical protein J5280_14695 [Rhizobium sp. K15/93]QYA01919.1 hypothetical protein J5278_01635 [Rhizobium sp. B21/90]
MEKKNPATAGCGRALNVTGLGGLDVQKPIENHNEVQSETLAIRTVMRRFSVSIWHAQIICRASGLGGVA